MKAVIKSDWSWTISAQAMSDMDGVTDPALRDVLSGWSELPQPRWCGRFDEVDRRATA
jgi:hypothetical protein